MNGLGVLLLFALFPGVPCLLWWRGEVRRVESVERFSAGRAALGRATKRREDT